MTTKAFFILVSLLDVASSQGKEVLIYENQNQLLCREISQFGATVSNGMCAVTCNLRTNSSCVGFIVTNQVCEHCIACGLSSPLQTLTSGKMFKAINIDFEKDLQQGKKAILISNFLNAILIYVSENTAMF